jgi:RimJ/RimL family protein N-acetyltransferase
MQKIGMIHEGTLRKYAFNADGEFIDVELYAITK